MGTWGVGSFENDTALDWVGDLVESDSITGLEEAIRAAAPEEPGLFRRLLGSKPANAYLDADIAVVALAAAAVVAVLRGAPPDGIPEELGPFLAKHRDRISPELAQQARKVVVRIGKESELTELWAESDDGPRWLEELAKLDARLA